jgi:A/G-specific adenine glycosylase
LEPSRRLLLWYERVRRDLPWRRTRDPWAIWVSEVMLQQTRVETVVPYFERFLARFPDPATLAAAPSEELLACWSGLGYYRRARQLQDAARAVVERGGLPRRAAELERLPGIGPYTAAAIASIAFDEPVPVLDGNVVRVASRLAAEAENPARAPVRRRLLAIAATLVDPRRPGDSNQALMELGATVCLPKRPRCGECPLRAQCAARARGDVEGHPWSRRRPTTVRVHHAAAVVRGPDGRVLLVRRGLAEEVLPGLWELPTVEATDVAQAERALEARYGGRWQLGERAAKLRHGITFRSIELDAYRADWVPAEIAETTEAAWIDPARGADLALTGATRKLLAGFVSGGSKRRASPAARSKTQ